jgi:hypothetical protein
MAQILVVNEANRWYQGVASLENYYEIELEKKIHKHASDAFSGYLTIRGKYTFGNRAGETSDGDLLLISNDFTKWVIVEIELVAKSLTHTKKQMRVFTDATFNVNDLINYCVGQDEILDVFRGELKTLFADPPEILVIFDSYHRTKLGQIQAEFKSIKICVFEVYKTASHDFETYRLSGEYPYVNSGYSYLKPTSGFEIYRIERPQLMNGVTRGNLNTYYQLDTIRSILMENKKDLFLKIPANPFTPDKELILSKTIDGRFIISPIN